MTRTGLDGETRNERICRLRGQGLTLEEIASDVNLTRERVRQILVKQGGPTVADVRSRAKQIQENEYDAIGLRVRHDVLSNPGTTIEEVAGRLELPVRTVSACLAPDLRRLVIEKPSPITSRWSDEDIFDSIRLAASYEFPLTTVAYQGLLDRGEIDGPSLPRIWQRFGGWQSVCDLAGVECGQALRTYDSTWTDADVRAFVREYLSNDDRSGTFQGYGEWRASQRPEAPSPATVRNRLGAWSEVKRDALRELYSSTAVDGPREDR